MKAKAATIVENGRLTYTSYMQHIGLYAETKTINNSVTTTKKFVKWHKCVIEKKLFSSVRLPV